MYQKLAYVIWATFMKVICKMQMCANALILIIIFNVLYSYSFMLFLCHAHTIAWSTWTLFQSQAQQIKSAPNALPS